MPLKEPALGFSFCCLYLLAYCTNKYVLSVLKFTYPTLFQGWQTFVGGWLLVFCGRLGWVEITHFSRSTAVSWLPGSLLFVVNIYAGSRSLSKLPIPIFFVLQNASEIVSYLFQRITKKERASWLKLQSLLLLLVAAGCLPFCDPQFDPDGYLWSSVHVSSVGAYRVFQQLQKSSSLSDLEQQYINYFFSMILLAFAAHPTGDLFGALEFPFLNSYNFLSGCCASGVLGFFLVVATVRLKRNVPGEHCGAWICLAKVLSILLTPLIFDFTVNISTLLCLLFSCLGEALLVFSDQITAEK
ncbi:transmembrane protein 241 isoform X1 [Erpetoichthys calabaricus]|uniref:transmembrane protein 241 isoform X1 n=1 Tax=Erpetoichthys calabaricus TaxID=27687 RepID=UPI0022347603|nr:transmembrane protein 241 isoform X1 [Erpetoichthys calabaricus]